MIDLAQNDTENNIQTTTSLTLLAMTMGNRIAVEANS